MRAVVVTEFGGPEVLRWLEVADPVAAPGEVVVRITASAVNRADLLQRQGFYPPPPGAPEYPGLECSGVVESVGAGVTGWATGDPCTALLAGGGYAEQVVVHAGSALRVPERLSLEEAAAVPEVFLTAYLNLFEVGSLPATGSALVHGGGSGVGTAAIQLIKAAGGRALITAGSEDKCGRCLELGADVAIDYRKENFAERVREETNGRGVDVVLDSIGASYLEGNLASLATGGRLVLIGLMGGAKVEVNLAVLLAKRLHVVGSTLRTRSVEEKAAIAASFARRFGADLASGRLRPIVDRVLPLADVAEAHRAMKASEHFGKIVLQVC